MKSRNGKPSHLPMFHQLKHVLELNPNPKLAGRQPTQNETLIRVPHKEDMRIGAIHSDWSDANKKKQKAF